MTTKIECARKECGKDATFSPILEVSPDGEHYARAFFPSLPVCQGCRDDLTVEMLVNDDGWKQIVAALESRGLMGPKREYTRVSWEEC